MEFSEGKNCRKLWQAIMIAEGPLSKGDFAGFNVHSKGTVHEMVSMFEKLDFLNSECEVS